MDPLSAKFSKVTLTSGENNDEVVFAISALVSYPPGNFSMNARYKDFSNKTEADTYIFTENQITTILTDLALKNTII
jgi:hypothetical protein